MYEVRFYSDNDNRYVVTARCKTLEEAVAARKFNGDLVVDARTNIVVDNDCWLWDWEGPNCYAKRWMGKQRIGVREDPNAPKLNQHTELLLDDLLLEAVEYAQGYEIE